MLSIALLKQDFMINRRAIVITYMIQLFSLLIAMGICHMRLIEISDMFWDTLPVVVIPAGMMMLLAYRVMMAREDDGTMELLLSTQMSPQRIFRTKLVFVLINAMLLLTVSTLFGCLTGVYRLTGVWKRSTYVLLNLGSFSLQVAVGGYCFCISCIAKRTYRYIRAAVVVPCVFYGIYLIYYLFPGLFIVQYLTPFSLFQQEWFAKRAMMLYIGSFGCVLIGILFLFLARHSFYERNIPE
ncbi:MAG: hypothetical protein Q4B57_00340 [Eubacteriales bacterium]|nr:hypothetical protein [Eubacteriales bacterium]